MPENQEERKQGSFIGKATNAYGTGRTVFGLGRAAVTAISAAGPEVWIVVGVITGLVLVTFLIVMVVAPVPFSSTPPAIPTPTLSIPTTAPPPPTP